MTGSLNLGNTMKILAVDDEEDVLETIVDALETARIDKASDFKTAEKVLRLDPLKRIVSCLLHENSIHNQS
jgi:DNA-binding response OmpR family regulator